MSCLTSPPLTKAPTTAVCRGGRLLRSGLLLAAFFLFSAVVGLFLADLFLPLPAELLAPRPLTSRVLDRHGVPLAEFGTKTACKQEWLDLNQMGRFLPTITVALEDRRFFSHSGVDFRSVARSLRDNLFHPGSGGGASTLTQQLVKLSLGRRGVPLLDKLIEILHARKIERHWPKRQILAAYLNRLDYGNRLIGPAAAAEAYFGKRPEALTLAEAIYLAGLPRSPTRLNPWRRPVAAAAEFRRSVSRLKRLDTKLPDGTSEGLELQKDSLSRLEPPPVRPWQRSAFMDSSARFFADEAIRRAKGKSAIVHTTLDKALQQKVFALASAHLESLKRPSVSAVAIVVLSNNNSKVRAHISLDLNSSEIDCTRLRRSPGSTLKPFVYLTALERRLITAATLLPDTRDAVRAVYPDYAPQNYSNRFLGPVRAREALANSLNVPAVVLLERVGARAMFHHLEGWGISFGRPFDDVGAGFVLGNCEVSPMDLAAAYAAIARGGVAVPPSWLESEFTAGRRRASASSCAIVADILSDNDARIREFGARSPLALPVRVAAKTGTSSWFRDAWAAGFTRDHTVVVWVGNSSGAPLGELPAIRAAAPLWRAIIDYLLAQGSRPLQLPESFGLESVEICTLTGLRASEKSPGVVREYFLPGTAPEESSAEMIDIEQGHAIPLLDAQYAAWCASPDNSIGARLKPNSEPKILVPEEGAVLALDREIPRAQQRIEFRATGIEEGGRWFVNEKEIFPENGRYSWSLESGNHTVRLETADGKVLSRRFKVLPAP